jgi:MFS family permease
MDAGLYKKYLLGVLLVVYGFNQVDQLAMGLVLQNMKADLALSDTQLGLLTGIAFALFYSIMGIPIARWADRGNRVRIIAAATALWSVMVALCGRAASFSQLLLIRVAVGVGEAGCMPPAQSLLADYFDREERPRALAIYLMGGFLSVVIGYLGAGWINQFYGWRATFVVIGLPGLALAALVWATLREPRTPIGPGHGPMPGAETLPGSEPLPGQTQPNTAPGLRAVCSTLWSNRTFRHLLSGYSVATFFANGISQWQPTFFIRSYHIQTGELGTLFTVINGVGGVLGVYAGGVLAARFAANNESLQLRATAVVYAGFGLVSSFIYLAPNAHMAFALMGVAFLGGAATAGPLFATIQTLVPAQMRATALALVLLFSNLVGLGLGPLSAGSLSDALRGWAGEQSLRYALLALSPGYLWAGWHLWRASKTVARDLEQVQGIDSQCAFRAHCAAGA